MKIRHPWLIKASGFAGAGWLRMWMRTLRYQCRALGAGVNPMGPVLQGRYIYVMWHEYLLLPIHFFAGPDICVLISQSADGQLITEVCRHLRIPVVRGSTTRGGAAAVRRLLREGHWTHLALTPDGPRGPRRHVQQGVVYLASQLGFPIVPVGFGLERPWRMGSWDRFAVARPGTRATCVIGEPIPIPEHAGKEQREDYRRKVEAALLEATGMAERWANCGAWPEGESPATRAG